MKKMRNKNEDEIQYLEDSEYELNNLQYDELKAKVDEFNSRRICSKNCEDASPEEMIKQINSIKDDKENMKVDEHEYESEEYENYEKLGDKIIKEGKLAVLTMAGGQGTRLGYNGPKGTFDIGLDTHESLFELICKPIKEANEKYGITIPWYIMTSHENNAETVNFFESHNYFGYPKEDIMFFIQGELPMIDKEGKILVNEEGFLKLAADGHGGVFESMLKSGALEDMNKRNIEWVFIGPVDNPIVQMVDEVMIGYAIDKKVLAVGKSIVKANPSEKVGVFCKRNGRPSVVEYTEISKEMSEETDENGELVFGESHINCNLFNIKAIEKIGVDKLPYHKAIKKATYMDENGKIVTSQEPDCYKFETFIFDSFGKLDNMEILRGKREEEFAPVKNKEGVDSPKTAKELYEKFWN